MKKIFAALLLMGAVLSTSAADGKWTTDFNAAREQAKKENKAILMDFTGSDWCGYCKKLKKEVFNTEQFQEWADKNLVLVEVDFPTAKVKQPAELKKANKALEERFKIEGYPTLVFADSTGKELGRIEGYEGQKPAEWINLAEKILAKGEKTSPK